MGIKDHKVLVVDDDLEMCGLLSDVLKGEDFSVTAIHDSFEASKILKKEEFDVIVTDLKMKGLKGLDLLEETNKVAPLTPVIIITAFGTIESAIKAMKMGAYDYITKPFKMDELVLAVRKALENRFLKKEVVRLRKEGPFIAVNCAAIPETLLESELFGYKKGAFTDARSDKRGLLFEANEGTLFLDEITEMPPTLQAKLLRVIEERKVRPLGDTTSYPIDVRIISTTNRDIGKLIREGRFREDFS